MLNDEDLIAYSKQHQTDAEYADVRARDIAENVKDELDNLISDIQLAIEYKPFKALKTVLKQVQECINTLDDVVSGAAD